jgi:uncharacterized repeat protein (TIGR01451 family)
MEWGTAVPGCLHARARTEPFPFRLAALLAALLCIASPVQAQVKRTFLNLSFEEPNLVTPGCRVYIPEQFVPGWDTDHPDYQSENSGGCTVPPGFVDSTVQGRILEVWHGPRDNNSGGPVTGRSGNQLAELNAQQFSRIFQNICLVNGETVSYKFSHRGRQSATVRDVMTMRIGTGANSTVATVGTTNNGAFDAPMAVQGTIAVSATAAGGWRDYTGTFTYVAPSGNTNIGFEAVSAAGGTTTGNFLDDIQVQLSPFVDFVRTSSSTPESATNDIPRLRVNGTLANPIQVSIRVGGTAERGVDYDFLPGTVVNGDVLLLTIPAGTYDWAPLGQILLPIQVIGNNIVDAADRTVEFEILPATDDAYVLTSNSQCGSPGNPTWVYSILDDDVVVTVVKEPEPDAGGIVGGDASLWDLVFRIEVGNPSDTESATYTLVDQPQMDPDYEFQTASVEFDGTTTTLAVPPPSVGWTLATGRTLAAGATDLYRIRVRVRIARPGTTANDLCTGPGTGIYNLAEVTVPGTPDPVTVNDVVCQNTPTPIWVTLNKALTGRAVAGDQARVQILAGGVARAQADTIGGAGSASTGTHVFAAGDLLGFSDIIGPNGDFGFGVADAPRDYATDIACTNAATAGSATILPTGPGVEEARRQFWGQFSTQPGDDITCTITNTPLPADLAIAKAVYLPGTSTPVTSVRSGATVDYVLVVSNEGQRPLTGAIVRDTPGTGLVCAPDAAVACTSTATPSACPATAQTVADLTSSAGVTLGTLPVTTNANSATLRFTCTVSVSP